MSDLLSSVLSGLSFGSVYALLAVGLVLTYRTTGVFNLAFGPQAFLAGAVYYDTHVRHGWPIWAAFVLSVVIISPLVGIVLDRFLFRYLRTASELAKLVSVLGLFVAIPEMIFLWFGRNPQPNAVGIVPHGEVVYQPIHNVYLNRDDIVVIAGGVLVFAGVSLLLRYTAFGLRMRSVVESSRLTELAGVNAERISMGSWALSSAVAGLAGVLLAPIVGEMRSDSYVALVMAAIAASVVGSLRSIPLAFAGGLGLGVLQEVLAQYLPTNSALSSGLRPALPFIALFLVLIFSPALWRRRALVDPLAGVDPPPPGLASYDRSPFFTRMTRIAAVLFFIVMGYYLFFHANLTWVDYTIQAAILSIIFLSITVITGFAGQISLCQASFAAIGACATAQLATRHGVSIFVAMLIGAGIAAIAGALVALPALRLGGVFLSLATLAFAFFFDSVLVRYSWIGGGITPIEAPRPLLGSVDFQSDKSFLVLVLVVLTVVSILVIWVRSGTTGRYLDAMRGSEVAAASIGISLNRARIIAFALSAAIAGLGGGLMASYEGAANVNPDFVPIIGLVWIVLVVTLGARTIEGAINAALGFVFFQNVVLPIWIPWLVNHVQPLYHMHALPAGLVPILFGLGALTYAKHPEGILEFQKRNSYALMERLSRSKRHPNGEAPDADGRSPEPVPPAGVAPAPSGGGAA